MVEDDTRENLKSAVTSHVGVFACLLAYVPAVVLRFVVPADFRFLMGIGVLVVGVVGAVFVFKLTHKLHGAGLGVLLGCLTLIPYVGLFVLLIVHARTTRLLKKHGITTRFLGANLTDL